MVDEVVGTMKPPLESACACILQNFWHGCPWSAVNLRKSGTSVALALSCGTGLLEPRGTGIESTLDVESFWEGLAVVSRPSKRVPRY